MLECLNVESLPFILEKITADIKAKLPESGAFENFCYVYESLGRCTPRILFEFINLGLGEHGYKCGVMIGGILPGPPLRKLSQHLLAGTRTEIITYFESLDVVQNVIVAVDKLDYVIQLHD